MAGKRARLDSKFQLKKCAKRYHGDNDRISQLPDEILVAILSWLSLKECACTSVVSSRWINLWKQTPYLNFNADSALLKIAQQNELCDEERHKFVTWVDHVLRSHQAKTLKELSVCFDLDQSFSKSITQWLEFAFARHVQKLQLDFSGTRDSLLVVPQYAFPEEFLNRRSSGGDIDFKSLKEVSFNRVDVTGETIEFFVSNCPLLEKVVVKSSNAIPNLKVCGPSLVLKHLEVAFCFGLKSVRVSAPNLTTLIVQKVGQLFLENVPMLVEVTADCRKWPNDISNFLTAFSSRISHLEVLTLSLQDDIEVFDEEENEETVLPTFPEFPKLKKLVIEYSAYGNAGLMRPTALIRAAPYLQEFVLRLLWCDPSRIHRKMEKIMKFPHQHLRVVKFFGYYGRSSDAELVRYMLKNCIILEKIFIDPNEPLPYWRSPLSTTELARVRTARRYAKKQLEALVPQHVELVIM